MKPASTGCVVLMGSRQGPQHMVAQRFSTRLYTHPSSSGSSPPFLVGKGVGGIGQVRHPEDNFSPPQRAFQRRGAGGAALKAEAGSVGTPGADPAPASALNARMRGGEKKIFVGCILVLTPCLPFPSGKGKRTGFGLLARGTCFGYCAADAGSENEGVYLLRPATVIGQTCV